MRSSHNKLILSMVIKNEADRYLRRALQAHREYIDGAVIIDDGSTDASADICREELAGIPLRLVKNEASLFANEVMLRKQQWAETLRADPAWILNLDADEIFEEGFAEQLDSILTNQTEYDAVYFRLYDMWTETHYREDDYWQAHLYYRPFLVRYRPGVVYTWRKTPQHCGRLPLTIQEFPYLCHPARLSTTAGPGRQTDWPNISVTWPWTKMRATAGKNSTNQSWIETPGSLLGRTELEYLQGGEANV